MSIISVGSITAVNARFMAKWIGPWVCEFDLDMGPSDTVPSGKVSASIATQVLVGTIDATASGRNGAKAKVRMVAGGNGWLTDAPAQAWTNDAGVLSTTVLSATAANVGETVVDSSPVTYGSHYTRNAGRASRVFGSRDWYVDLSGVTQLAPRPTPIAPDDLAMIDWDPYTQILTLASNSLILPGLQITNPTIFDGTLTVRDVEQTFSESGSRAECLCSASTVNRLWNVLGKLAQESTGITYARTYPYRVVDQGGDGRLDLQAMNSGAPDLKLAPPMYGEPGMTAKIAPSSTVLVTFAPDRTSPIAVSYDSTAPLEVDHSATLSTFNGSTPVALAPAVTQALNAIVGIFTALATPLTTAGPAPVLSAALGAAITAAVAAMQQALATAEQQIPSNTLQAG